MDLFIDGVPFYIRHGESLSKNEILEVIAEELASRGQVLKEIVCHGEAMGEDGFLSIIDEVEADFISCSESDITEEVMSEVGSSAAMALSLIDDRSCDMDGWLTQIGWICEALRELDPLIADMDLTSMAGVMEGDLEDVSVIRPILESLKGRFFRPEIAGLEKGDEF